MNWSVRPDRRFRLALGSFVEEYNNKVQVKLVTKVDEFQSNIHFHRRSSLWTRTRQNSRPRARLTILTPPPRSCGSQTARGYIQVCRLSSLES